ncbi:MAG: ankyrin repeat domain-containing protein [Bacteroidota bacterium]
MKRLFLLLILLPTVTLVAQDNNIFLDRDFWKSAPDVELIKQKIAEGHDPTVKNEYGFDGLAYGIIDNAPLGSLKYMLNLEGNPVTKPTHGGVTYLLWAAYMGNIDAVEHLLELGSDPYMATSRGTNMLLMAAIGGVDEPEMYELIVEQGIPLDYRNHAGANALLVLSGSEIENLEIFHYLLDKGLPLHSVDHDGNNVFNYAARGGSLEIMKMWQEKGVDFEMLNAKGENAVLFAAQGTKRRALRMEVFDFLTKDLKLEPDLVSREGKTPIHYAARRADKALIQFFMDEGVSMNQLDHEGNLAIYNAVGEDMDKLQLCLDHTHNINHTNKEGNTVLTRSIRWRSKVSFDMLLANGANAKIIDQEGNNLLYHAFDAYRQSSEATSEHIIGTLKELGVKGDGQFSNGNTLAHVAIEKQSPFLLKKAVALGVDINVKNDLHLSPLHLAAMKATNDELLTILIEHGADRNLRTDFDESAYDLAHQNELLQENNINYAFLQIE